MWKHYLSDLSEIFRVGSPRTDARNKNFLVRLGVNIPLPKFIEIFKNLYLRDYLSDLYEIFRVGSTCTDACNKKFWV